MVAPWEKSLIRSIPLPDAIDLHPFEQRITFVPPKKRPISPNKKKIEGFYREKLKEYGVDDYKNMDNVQPAAMKDMEERGFIKRNWMEEEHE